MEETIFRALPKPSHTSNSQLTPREGQVLSLVERGFTNGEIAMELGIRLGTVKIHLKHLYGKIGVRGRYHLALAGLKDGGVLTMAV